MVIRRVLLLVLFIQTVTLFTALIHAQDIVPVPPQEAAPVSKPGCPTVCGNLTVPYPFGIGAGCFLDKWFEIVCSNGSQPFLSNTATNLLLVTRIDLKGTVMVTRTDWVDQNNTEESLQFQGSPLKLPDFVRVPIAIEWGLLNYSTVDVFGASLPISQINDTDRRVGPTLLNSSCHLINSTRLQCSCPLGYTGNPYLLNGCQDIDDCNLSFNFNVTRGLMCGRATECQNLGGGFLCIPKSTPRDRPIFIGVGSGLGALLLFIGSWGLYTFVMRRKQIQRKQMFFKRNGGILLQQQLSSNQVNAEKAKLFDSEELKKATNHFNENRILGQGGQGTVYKGMLADGNIVAVKKSKILDQAKVTEFINEIVILSQINHRNIVKLLGCCLEAEVPLLVYEFIPNGTLSHYIQDPTGDIPLTWEMRLRIATEIAGALSYLHFSAALPIYHRDIKSTNILLDEKYRAKVADFGTSRTVSIDQTHLTTLVYGTFGYLDPEYFQSSQFTDKSDVYSFGVVLVELLTGQKPISVTKSNEGRSLSAQFMLVMEEERLFDIVDTRVAKEGEKEAVVALAALAKRCLNLNGKRRPTMKEVAAELERILKSVEASNGNGQFCIEVPESPAEPVSDFFNNSMTWSSSYEDESCSSSGRLLLSSQRI